MLKIGEFARLSQVSIKMLRHYDALGVLRLSRVDSGRRVCRRAGVSFASIGLVCGLVEIVAILCEFLFAP